ncbi:hypothetical protein JW988_00420 [Candidatus Bathyarchaeota archaeon]|nr:hypothetical protein [Candidatus Bathyarchaeota archaeon]
MKTSKIAVVTVVLVLIVSPIAYAALSNQLEAGAHGVGLLKTADAFAYIGDSVTYKIQVYNPSEFGLFNINVSDPMLGLEETIPFLAAGNTTGVTFVMQREVLGTDPNPLVNTVSVEAVDSEGAYSTASTQAVTEIAEKWLEITKTGPEFAHVGDAVTYTIVVENVGESDLANVTVNDEMLGFAWMGDLSVAELNVFNVTYVVPGNASDPLTNVVTAYAEVNETIVYAESECSIDILHPMLNINKTVEPQEVCGEQNVTFTITVNNTGDAELYNLTLTDSMYGDAPDELIPSMLAPAESFVWSFNATVSNKCFVNKAKATGVDVLGNTVYACDKVSVYVKCPVCPRSKGYWKNHPDDWTVEEVEVGNVTYSKEDAMCILKGANSKDATHMLLAQFIAAKLNRNCGTTSVFTYRYKEVNIDTVIVDVDVFLGDHPLGSDPRGDARQEALSLKDLLDAYNNQSE